MRHALFAIAIAAAGCAAQSSNRSTDKTTVMVVDKSGHAEKTVCKEERPTGSNISRTICRSEEEADDEADAGKDWMKKPRAEPTTSDDPFKRVNYRTH